MTLMSAGHQRVTLAELPGQVDAANQPSTTRTIVVSVTPLLTLHRRAILGESLLFDVFFLLMLLLPVRQPTSCLASPWSSCSFNSVSTSTFAVVG